MERGICRASLRLTQTTVMWLHLRRLIKISRPRFWFYTAGPFLLGYMAGLPKPRDLFTPMFWLPFLFFLIPANVFIYGINDLFDRETDALNAAKKGDAARENLLTDEQARMLRFVLFGVIFLAGLYFIVLPGTLTRGIFALFMLLCTVYSAPPRLKAIPFLDSYSNVLYVLPGYLGYTLTAGTLPPAPILIGGMLWAAGMHAYSALPDIAPDREAGITTVAVRLGERGGLIFVMLNWLVFALLMLSVIGAIGLPTLVYPLIPLVLLFRPPGTIRRVYWWFPLLNGAMGFLAFVALNIF
jgi:lycopene elongase/hydratase (dihydrobisanhydrobacterioruberin-forming)